MGSGSGLEGGEPFLGDLGEASAGVLGAGGGGRSVFALDALLADGGWEELYRRAAALNCNGLPGGHGLKLAGLAGSFTLSSARCKSVMPASDNNEPLCLPQHASTIPSFVRTIEVHSNEPESLKHDEKLSMMISERKPISCIGNVLRKLISGLVAPEDSPLQRHSAGLQACCSRYST